MKRIMMCASLVLVGVSMAMAQMPTATIVGTVKDSSEAIVAGASLTARNTDTGQTRNTVSDSDGFYRFDALPVGSYEVQVQMAGFKESVRSGITLIVAQQSVVDFTLEVGSVQQQVEVTAAAPIINTTDSTLGGVMDETQMADLPLNGRNYMQLALVQAGIDENKMKPTNFSTSMGGGAGSMFSTNGAPLRSNNYMLDGTQLASYGGATNSSISGETLGLDGIREFKIITSNFPAQYGMTMGSQMVMVSKSGTNIFHGDAFEYLRNSALDAKNYFDSEADAGTHPDGVARRLPEFRRSQFGGAFGGPIKKDKTFFFGTYEGLRQVQGTSNTADTIPNGCRGAAGATITNTECSLLGSVSSVVIAPVVAPWLPLFTAPNVGTNVISFSYPAPTTEDYAQIRVDHTFSSSDNLFGRYTFDKGAFGQTTAYPGSPSLPTNLMMFFTTAENHIFSPTVLNTVRFSYSRSGQTLGNGSATYATGPDFSFEPGFEMGPVSIGGVTGLSAGGNPSSHALLATFAFSDDVFVTRGRHSFQYGTLINRFVQFTANGTTDFGQISFTNMALFLQGIPTSYEDYAPPFNNIKDVRYYTLGFYVQDDWKMTSRLTVNLGLRYEPNTSANEIHGNQNALRNPFQDVNLTPGKWTENPSFLNISPRFGFAWDVAGDGKTAVRGGVSLLYNVAGWYGNLHQMKIAPYENLISVQNTTNAVITLPFNLPTSDLADRTGNTLDFNMKQPKLLDYNFSVQRQFPFQLAVTLAYAGSRGYNLMSLPYINPFVPLGVPGTTSAGLETCVPRPAGYLPIPIAQQNYRDGTANTCWLGTGLFPNASEPTETRINPYWQDINWLSDTSYSWYNSLQVTVEKHLTHGLQVQSNFVWSKSLDTNQAQSTQDSVSYSTESDDELHLSNVVSPSSFNVPFAEHLTALYHFPGITGNAFAEKALNGWWASTILSFQSGYPFTPGFSDSRSRESGTGGGPDRPDLLPGRNNSNITRGYTAGCPGEAAGQKLGTAKLYFDPCAFSIQPLGFLGNEPLNDLIGPNYHTVDISLVKDTRVGWLGEAGSIQFRVEAFNSLNRANFEQPNRTIFAGNGPATGDVEPVLANAGAVTLAFPSRQLQFALKLMF